MAQWLFATRVELEPGQHLQIHFRDGVQNGGAITEWDPPHALAFEWGDSSLVRLSLEPEADGTLLRLVHSLLPFSDTPGTLAGWHAHLVAFEAVLYGESVDYESVFD